MNDITPPQVDGLDLALLDFEPPAPAGSLYVKDTTGFWTFVPPGTFGEFLRSAGPGALPAWVPGTGLGDMLASTYDPTNIASDAFDIANHYITGQIVGDLLVFFGGAWTRLPAGAAGLVLRSNGPGILPAWQASPGMLATIYDPTNIASDAFDIANHYIASQTTGDLLVFNGSAWARLVAGSLGTVLASNGLTTQPSFQAPPSSVGYIDGYTMTWTTAAQVTVSAGNARNTTDTFTIRADNPIVIDITVSGAGGLDTGAEAASTWYAVLVIGDTEGVNPTDGLLTLTPSAPTLPAGYDVWRRVGWARNDSSLDFLDFGQTGTGRTRRITYRETASTLAVLGGVSSATWVAAPLSVLVPSTSRWVYLYVAMEQDSALHSARFRETGSGLTEVGTPHVWAITDDTAGTARAVLPDWGVPCDASQSIDYATTGTTSINVSVVGYEDEV